MEQKPRRYDGHHAPAPPPMRRVPPRRRTAPSRRQPAGDHYLEKSEGRGKLQAVTQSLDDAENPYLLAQQDTAQKSRRRLLLRKALLTLVCLLLSFGFNFLPVQLPYTPSSVSIEFSALPELLVCLCVHPLAAAAVVLVKNGAYYFVNPEAVVSIPNKILLNLFFVLAVWCLRQIQLRRFHRFEEENEFAPPLREPTVLPCTVLSAVVTALLSAFTFRYLAVPLLYRWVGYVCYDELIASYQTACRALAQQVPLFERVELTSLRQCVLFYNIPLNLIKYLCCGIVGGLVSIPLDRLMNGGRSAQQSEI